MLLGAFEQELHAHTQPQYGNARVDPLVEELVQGEGAQVPHPVVEDGDQRRPLVEGTPCTRASSETASRSARANALNDASTMWWAFAPASTVTCTVSLAVFATARRNSSARSVSKS